jgi:chromosome segregation ATPase
VIEQGIYFGLGCAVAGLCALGFAPLWWARAIRLTRQRLQVQIPVSMREIMADRDHLRAEFAVERRKLEQAMERVRATKAADMGELGRRAVAIVDLTDALAAARGVVADQAAEIARLARVEVENDAERGALRMALHDNDVYYEQALEAYHALRQAHQALEELLEERRATIAALHTRVMGLEMTIEDADRARAALERRIEFGQQEELTLREERDRLSDQLVAMDASREVLRKRLAGETARADEMEAEKAVMKAGRDVADAKIQRLEAELETARLAIDEARDREKGIHLQTSLRAEQTRGASRAVTETLEALQADNAALRGALDAARVRPGPNGATASGHDADPFGGDDAFVRASIHGLGLAIATLSRGDRLDGDGDKPAQRDGPNADVLDPRARLEEPEVSAADLSAPP